MGTDLNARLETAAQTRVPAATNGKAVEATNAPPDKAKVLRAEILRMQPEFQKAMPTGLEATQLVRDAITVLRQVPKLAECNPRSVLGALMTSAQLGLRVGVLGQAYVLPYWSNAIGGFNAQFVLGYRGIVELAFRSDLIADIGFRAVREKDIFDCDYGSGEITHKPEKREAPGETYGYYAVVRYKGGGRTFFFMNKREAEEFRDEHASARDKNKNVVGPWRDHFDAMAGKTCLKQLAKTMPQGKELATALVADESLRVDYDARSDAGAVSIGLDVIDGSVVERDEEGEPLQN